jgi:hypothetical protein
MPLVSGLPPEAAPLYEELRSLAQYHSGRIDYFFYNVGTAVALLSSGAATVVTTVRPVVGASLSAVATFFFAMTRILQFGRRWTTELARQGIYAKMIYDLNSAAHLNAEAQLARVAQIYERMGVERLNDGKIAGTGGGD